MRKHNSGFCQECGRWRDTLHRDHIVPRWKGGPDTPDNIQFVCANCHEDKTREDLVGLPPNRGMLGRKHSDETRAKLSAARQGRQPMLGKRHSAETRAAYSVARRGAGNPHFGKPQSEETRAKMRAAWVRRSARASTCGAGNPHFGIPQSDEARAKMRAAWVLRKARTANA